MSQSVLFKKLADNRSVISISKSSMKAFNSPMCSELTMSSTKLMAHHTNELTVVLWFPEIKTDGHIEIGLLKVDNTLHMCLMISCNYPILYGITTGSKFFWNGCKPISVENNV